MKCTRPRPFARPAAVLLAVLLSGCGRNAEKPPEGEPPAAPVHAATAERVELAEWVEFPGTTQPLPGRAARITAPVEGRVLEVLAVGGSGAGVVEGERVRAGQAVVRLDDRLVRASRAKAEAALNELDAQVRAAGAAVRLAEVDVTRLKPLEASAGGSSPPLVARADVEKARLTLESAQLQEKAAIAKRASGAADLKQLDEQLQLYTLRAPIAGHLGTLQVVTGQTLAVGALVADVIDLGEIDVLCFVAPSRVAALAVGQPAALPERHSAGDKADGKVAFVAVQAQPDTGTFAVKVRFPNPDLGLRANQFVHVRVRTQPPRPRLVIPESALMEDQKPPAVIVVRDVEAKPNDKGETEKVGKAHRLLARVGVRDPERRVVEVLGLTEPEKKTAVALEGVLFVTSGGHGLHDDDAVRLEEEEPEKGEKKEEAEKGEKKEPEKDEKK